MATEDNLAILRKGETAVLLRRELDSYLMDEEEEVIKRAVAEYDSGSLTDIKMRGIMGELSALRRLSQKLANDVQQGAIARERMIDDGTTTEFPLEPA